MQQRAAIARALIHDPKLILMDEPFGALDALTREKMNIELLRIWEEAKKTIVFVTHGITEAVFLGTRVIVLTAGPARMADNFRVELPHPRTLDMKTHEKFGEYTRRIYRLLAEWSDEHMAQQRLGIIMNGVTGRMGMNQHLIRSIVAIRAQGGVALKNGDRVMPDPILVGRNAGKARAAWPRRTASRAGPPTSTPRSRTRTTRCSSTPRRRSCAPSCCTRRSRPARTSIARSRPPRTLEDALDVARAAKKAGIRHGVVQDKLFLPGLLKLKTLIDSGFFGRILSVRGEFGYWVFEGDWQPAQRPSWNYRKKDGGGIILDMLCHWRYVLDNLFGEVKSVSCLGATHIPKRWDENGKPYKADVDDAAYATFQLAGGVIAHINSSWCTRVRRDDLVTFHVDGTPRLGGRRAAEMLEPGARQHAAPGVEPGRAAADQFLRDLERGARQRRLRQRLQGRMGDVHPPSLRGRAVQMDAGRRRQGRAARRGRAQELEGTALDRHPAAEGVR